MLRRGVLIVAAYGAVCAVSVLVGCRSAEKREHAAMMAEPVEEGWGETKNVSRAGDVTFSAQPTEGALESYSLGGGRMVIDLRAQEGADAAGFDEASTVRGLGMDYVHIPVSPASFSTEDVKRFVEAMREADGPVLVHCGSSNRVGGMWAAYLALEKGWETEAAMEAGRAAGMRSESVEEATLRVIGR